MSDFVQTVKDWKRMCGTFNSCDACPLDAEDDWASVLCSEGGIMSARPEIVEKVIAKWAAEHPEPVYPTWEMYLAERMTADMRDGKTHNPQSVEEYMRRTRIPADIAEKLGIQPKEGV